MKTIDWRRAAAWVLLASAALALRVDAQAPVASSASVPAASRNVYLASGTVRPTAPVEGDLVAFGGRVTVDQAVKGDALLVGGSVDVRAPIGDDLRAAGGDVNIDDSVGGELYAVAGNVTLNRQSSVAQGARLAGGSVTIDGRIDGTLEVSAQRVVLGGEVTGDARLLAESIELGPTARIGGSLHYAAKELKKAEGAVVGGETTREERKDAPRERGWSHHWHWQASAPSWTGLVMGYVGLLAAGAVFVLLFPRFSSEAPDRIRDAPWLSLAVGLATLVGVPVLAVLLCLTLLGIPLGLAVLALYPLLLLAGYLAGVLFVAQRARMGLRNEGVTTVGAAIGFLALALLILALVASLPVVGPLTVFITTLAGLGACVLEWQRRRRSPPAATA